MGALGDAMGGDFHGIVGVSEPMCALFDAARRVARAEAPVLITGESGVGKELVACAIHKEGPRAQHAFVPVNCAGIPSDLLESELFGHAAGAFTGAQGARKGLFAEANGGTLLLDEIGEMSWDMQAKLLRVLEDRRVRPVGADRERSLDVRIIAATNRDLEGEVRAGRFRDDLFYRLDTFALRVPPLRERGGEDLDRLTRHFLALMNTRRPCRLADEARARLHGYAFPGNVRELANVVERAATFCRDGLIRSADLPPRLRAAPAQASADGAAPFTIAAEDDLPTLAEVGRRYIEYVLAHTDDNKQRAAAILAIGRRTLYRRLGRP